MACKLRNRNRMSMKVWNDSLVARACTGFDSAESSLENQMRNHIDIRKRAPAVRKSWISARAGELESRVKVA